VNDRPALEITDEMIVSAFRAADISHPAHILELAPGRWQISGEFDLGSVVKTLSERLRKSPSGAD